MNEKYEPQIDWYLFTLNTGAEYIAAGFGDGRYHVQTLPRPRLVENVIHLGDFNSIEEVRDYLAPLDGEPPVKLRRSKSKKDEKRAARDLRTARKFKQAIQRGE